MAKRVEVTPELTAEELHVRLETTIAPIVNRNITTSKFTDAATSDSLITFEMKRINHSHITFVATK
jgi:hypothetical protein